MKCLNCNEEMLLGTKLVPNKYRQREDITYTATMKCQKCKSTATVELDKNGTCLEFNWRISNA